MKTKKRRIGDLGEDFAEKYLKKRGWRILSRNYLCRQGEIDIIGYRFGVLAYFEVKSRSSDFYGMPRESVDEEKLKKLQRAIRHFKTVYFENGKIPVFYPFGIERKQRVFKERIDIIEIYLSREYKLREINHIKGELSL